MIVSDLRPAAHCCPLEGAVELTKRRAGQPFPTAHGSSVDLHREDRLGMSELRGDVYGIVPSAGRRDAYNRRSECGVTGSLIGAMPSFTSRRLARRTAILSRRSTLLTV